MVQYAVPDGQPIPTIPYFGQHPPFFSKMRTFFKNRPPWYKFYSNSPVYHGGRFLTHPKTKKSFFSLRDI
jgi:hypothetical protein